MFPAAPQPAHTTAASSTEQLNDILCIATLIVFRFKFREFASVGANSEYVKN